MPFGRSSGVRRRSGRSAAAVAALVAVLGGLPALADVAPAPPEHCPAGSFPDSCHGGSYCAPRECTDDSACDEGLVCRELALCTGQVHCGGREGPGTPVTTVKGACSGGSCTEGTCQTLRVCASRAGSSSGCNLAPSAIGIAATAGALFAAALVLGRRRLFRRR